MITIQNGDQVYLVLRKNFLDLCRLGIMPEYEFRVPIVSAFDGTAYILPFKDVTPDITVRQGPDQRLIFINNQEDLFGRLV